MKLSEIFRVRAKGVTALLTTIHHDAMDILFAGEFDSFTLADVIALLEKDGNIVRHEIIAENKNRIKLISVRMLKGLCATDITRELPGKKGVFVWNLSEGEERKQHPSSGQE